MDIQRIKKFIKNNKIILLLFTLATFFFVYQHLKNISWDFSAYVLNAKYLFYEGSYFETLRPPLTPILLGIFLIFGTFGEYIYIIFVSGIFLYSSIKLSDICFKEFILQKKINLSKEFIRLIFYFFSLGIFTLIYSTSAGTELLGLTLFELFLVAVIKQKISGHYLALAFLSRYSFLIFTPFLFFNKKIKKIIQNIFIFGIIISPWLIFNYFKFGNPFVSIIDSYVNNILFRDYLFQQLNPLDIFKLTGNFLPFILIGLFFSILSLLIKRKNWFNENKIIILFLFITFLIIFDYNNIPLKQIRYLFNLTLPFAFLSSFGILLIFSNIKKINNEKWFKLLKIIIVILFIFNIIIVTKLVNNESYSYYKFYSASQDIKKLGLENCEILTPHWVLMNYLNGNAYPLAKNNINLSLEGNKIILIFKKEVTIDDLFDLEELDKYNKLYETKEYLFLTKENFDIYNCSKKYVYNSKYIENHCEIIGEKLNYFNSGKFFEKICNFLTIKN